MTTRYYFLGMFFIAVTFFYILPVVDKSPTATTFANIKHNSEQFSTDRGQSSSHTESMENKDMDRLGPKPVFRGKSVGSTSHFTACPSMVSGMDFVRNPRLFKGMAFNLEERQGLGNSS